MTAAEISAVFQIVPLSALAESDTNPRRHFDEKKLDELADNVKQHGVLVPLLVRPFNGWKTPAAAVAKFEIVAGARRFRAAKRAALDEIPVRVVDLDDKAALEVQVIENLQREDVHPLEESEGFRRLLDLEGYTAELLAEKVGRDESYIYKRLQLSKLIEPLKGKFLEGEIQLAHAVLLCRLSEAGQIDVAKEGLYENDWMGGKNIRYVVTARKLDAWIREEIYLDLKAAVWDKTDAQLVPKAGACNVCPKRSGANAQLFDDFPKGDVCLDSACFTSKREAHLVQVEKKAAAAGEKLLRVATEYLQPADEKKLKAIGSHGYSKVEGKKKCSHAEKALVVAGRADIGKIIDVCREKTCKTHHPYGSSAGRNSQSLAEAWNQRKKNLDLKIRTQTRREWWLGLLDVAPTKLGRAELDIIIGEMIGRCHHSRRVAICATLGIEPKKVKGTYGTNMNHEAPLKAHVKGLSDELLVGFMVAFCFTGDLEAQPYATPTDVLKKTAAGYGVNVDLIARQVSAPLLAKFEKAKKSAQAKQAVEKKSGKKTKPAKKAPEPEGVDEDGDEE